MQSSKSTEPTRLATESPPAVVETHSGEITLATGPGLAKTRPSNVIPFLRRVGQRW